MPVRPMPVRIVQSKQNARLKELRRALAKPPREAGDLAGIEGPNLVAEALRTGLRLQCIFVAEEKRSLLDEFSFAPETEILLVPRALLDSVLETEMPQPVAALVEAPAWNWNAVLPHKNGAAPLVIVLAGLQDPGNLGTILRSAEAFGASGAVSLPGTVSEWNAKAVRASAGSVFRVPLVSATAEECIARLRESGVRLWTTAVHGAKAIARVDLAAPVALIIGNEGNGVPAELAARTGGALTIPCPGQIESLNAAVAASVLLYEAARQRAGNERGWR